MKNCFCQAELLEGAKFCPSCGRSTEIEKISVGGNGWEISVRFQKKWSANVIETFVKPPLIPLLRTIGTVGLVIHEDPRHGVRILPALQAGTEFLSQRVEESVKEVKDTEFPTEPPPSISKN